jgi:peptidoglycan/LPS O-acetylase OafA/YrhL
MPGRYASKVEVPKSDGNGATGIHPLFHLTYHPSLDGVRGLAILSVVLGHLPALPLPGGFLGVDLCFVLSGFLITALLCEEWVATNNIGLRRFYARRALRLLPALIVTLLAVFVVSHLREPAARVREMEESLLIALFYSSNWFTAFGSFPHGVLAPTWSLSIEEQYYLIWPILLWALFRLKWRRGAIVTLLVSAILASAALRAVYWSGALSHERAYFGSDGRADGLLIGSLAGLLASWGFLPKSRNAIILLNLSAVAALTLFGSLLFNAWLGASYLYF